MIKYELNPNQASINWEEAAHLFKLVEWDNRTSNEVKKSFSKSSHVLVALENKIIVGFGRTVDDGKYYALIVDVVVRPSHQGKGIGKNIVETLKKELKGYNFITLTSAPNKDGFYKKLGWKKQKSSYIWPKDEKQIKEHCELE